MKNTELLARTLIAIEGGEVHWDQGNWCHCFAGNAMRLNGSQPYVRLTLESDEGTTWTVYVRDDEGREVNVSTRATEVLGLTDEEATKLFASGNTLEDLKVIVSSLLWDDLVEDTRTKEMVNA